MNHHNYNDLFKIFEAYIADHQPKGFPDSLYAPMHYINDIGGKRIRPVLLLMAYNLWHEDIAPALPAAQAIEYFHNFSLMHDDIMDEAPLRRGQESVHIHFDRNAAILAGDAMMIRSFDLLLELDQNFKTVSSLTHVLVKAAGEICEGQQLDMDFEKMDSPSQAEYMEMIRKKTACLIGASLKIGALLAGATHEIADRMYAFGESIGMAFQIQDDILDVFGDAEITGKIKGGDILRGKKNFLYVRAFNSIAGQDRMKFKEMYTYAADENNIKAVLDLYSAMNIEEYARGVQQTYYKSAIKELSELGALNYSKIKLFVGEMMERKN